MKRKENEVKENEQFNFNWNKLGEFLNTTQFISQWSTQDKIKLFAAYFIKPELASTLEAEEDAVKKQTLTDLNRLDIKEYKRLEKLVNFTITDIVKLPCTSYSKIFLMLLPESLLPSYSL